MIASVVVIKLKPSFGWVLLFCIFKDLNCQTRQFGSEVHSDLVSCFFVQCKYLIDFLNQMDLFYSF